MTNQVKAKEELSFIPVPYAHFPIEKLSPADIDSLLINGYFRNGTHVHTSLGKYISGVWHPSLMLRIPLQSHQWKKRSRKLLRRNAPHFDVRIRPFQARQEIEELWKLFKTTVHQWKIVGNLGDYLLRGKPALAYQNYELSVYHKYQLVAFSVFDKGGKSIASLEAAYHPDFQKYSLGYYTFLLEMEYGISQGLSWHYPGFYPRGLSMFDYKLRPGGIEFFRLREKKWLPWEEVKEEDWLAVEVERKLGLLQEQLVLKNIQSSICKKNRMNYPGLLKKESDHQIYLELRLQKGEDSFQRVRIGYDIENVLFEVFGQAVLRQESKLGKRTSAVAFLPQGQFKRLGKFAHESQIFEYLNELS